MATRNCSHCTRCVALTPLSDTATLIALYVERRTRREDESDHSHGEGQLGQCTHRHFHHNAERSAAASAKCQEEVAVLTSVRREVFSGGYDDFEFELHGDCQKFRHRSHIDTHHTIDCQTERVGEDPDRPFSEVNREWKQNASLSYPCPPPCVRRGSASEYKE